MVLPASFCNKINIAGIPIIKTVFNWSFIFLILVCKSLMYFATANTVATLANSPGWIVKPPSAYQEVEPETVFPKMNNPIRDNIETK